MLADSGTLNSIKKGDDRSARLRCMQTEFPFLLRLDGIHRADIVTGPAIDTGIQIYHMLSAFFAYRIDRTYPITCSTVVAIIGYIVSSHVFTSLSPQCFGTHQKAYNASDYCQYPRRR